MSQMALARHSELSKSAQEDSSHMRSGKIVCTAPIDQIAVDILRPFGEIVVAPDGRQGSLVPLLADAIALVVRGDGVANTEVLNAGRSLKVIGRSGAGYESVDVEIATTRRIPVVYVPAAGSRAVAEAAVAFMTALCKGVGYWDQQLKRGNWKSRDQSKPGDLDGAILGIVGLGHCGQILAQLMRPFNMVVLAYDPYASRDRAKDLGVDLVSLEELLRRSNFVSLHAPLTGETRGLINRQTLKAVRRGTYLINLARGGLIENLDVLLEALETGALAGVGLDVFDPEPPDFTHPLFRHPNCLASPHALAMTEGAMAKIFKSMAEDMAAVLCGGRPRFVVNPEVFD
jgi:phosphoglycerate dehydrogenase-like enzyme